MNLKPGDKIPLVLQLFDNAVNKFVRAVVRDASDTQIAGSPFALAHEANGLYTNSTAEMPNTPFISVQYLVYDDAGFTTLSSTHSSVAVEIPIDYEISGGVVSATVEDETATGVVESSPVVTGVVCECD